MIKAGKALEYLNQHMLADGLKLVMDLDKSEGSWLVDKTDNSRFLDLYTMYASQSVGYNHPRLKAATEELGRAAVIKPTCSEIFTTEMAEFMEVFSRLAMTDYLNRAFFIEGGALAVENALKAAFDWKVRRNLAQGKGEKGGKVIHFKEAFHGRSGYTLSLTNTDSVQKIAHFPTFDWPRVLNPKASFPLEGDNLARTKDLEAQALAQINQAVIDYKDDIASIIIEPIQGEGGDNHFRPQFMAELRRICDDNEMLLIFDEVQTGVGLTGKFWAHEHFGVKPDLISFGKKTQVCGVLAGPKMDEVPENVFRLSGRISSTFGGSLVDMVRCKHILSIIEDEGLVDRAAKLGRWLLEAIQELAGRFPGQVTNPRGLGLMCAFDLPDQKSQKEFIQRMFENKVLMAPCGTRTIRLRPHLVVEKAELEGALELMGQTLSRMAQPKAA